MARTIDWAVNVDKLRVCFTMPENLYGYLNEHYTRRDELTDARILDEDTFSLVFIEEMEWSLIISPSWSWLLIVRLTISRKCGR
jgi:hypothetical protein